MQRPTSPSRHQRRADMRCFRRAASLLTFLVAPDDPALNTSPLLKAAAADWIGALPVRIRHCLACGATVQDVGALLLSMPASAKPGRVAVAPVCRACWDAGPGPEAFEQPASAVLQSLIPGGTFAPLVRP